MILATTSSDPSFHGDVRAALNGRFSFEAAWDLRYEEAARFQGVGAGQACLNVVDFTNPAPALAFSRALSGKAQLTTIAVNAGAEREDLLLLMQAGIRDVLPRFTARELILAVHRALALLGASGEVLADVYAFVPAKPGCGSTTVATHTAGLLARSAPESPLLLDFDLRLGVTSFLLKSEGTRTILDALAQVDRLDRGIWANLISQIGKLHLLGSGAGDLAQHFPSAHFTSLLDYAMRQYSTVLVDLPGGMEDHECEALARARRIFLVCTPCLGALHVARRKAQWLRDLQVIDKVSVMMNNVEGRGALSLQEMERIIQMPVRYAIPAASKDVARAAQQGEIIDSKCPLGRALSALAAELSTVKAEASRRPAARRFVEYFSVSPARSAWGN